MLFQALGSQYTYLKALRHLFTIGSKNDTGKLKDYLSKHYGGEVALYQKGRSALSAAIKIATGGSGKVAISGFTCYSVVQAVEAAGCSPVYVDITKTDLNFSAATLEKMVKKHSDIKCVVVQNTLGMTCDIVAIRKIADQYKLILIEDLAHALGANYADGSEAGTAGDMVMLSFGRDKAVDVGGGGAMIVRKKALQGDIGQPATKINGLASFRDRIYPMLMWHVRKLYAVKIGKLLLFASYRLGLAARSADGDVDLAAGVPGWQAKRVLAEIESLDQRRAVRISNAKSYLAKLPHDVILADNLNIGSVPIRLPILAGDRAKQLAAFSQAGMLLEDTWYNSPIAPARFYSRVDYSESDCPVAVEVAKNIVNLPVHEGVTAKDIDEIVEIVQGG